MHVNIPNHIVCLNDVHFIDSIVTFVVYYAKVIVVKSICLDYVDVREARSCGSMSGTRFQHDKGNVLKCHNLKLYISMLLKLNEGKKIIFNKWRPIALTFQAIN